MLTHRQTQVAEQFAQNPVKHLLVDLDGTLLGNRPLPLGIDFVRRAFGELKAYGSTGKIFKALMSIQREFTEPSSELTNDLRVVEMFSKQMNLSVEEGRRVLREGALLIFPDLRRHFYPIEGAKEFLDWAKDHYPLTLATNPVWPPEIVELRVQWAGIDPKIFGSMTHIRKMHACKPASRYYRDILEQQELHPEDCLLIGDNTKMDLPATKVGIRVFIVGKKSKLGPLRFTGAEAPAWRGTYPDLRRLLELAGPAARGK
jgi:FMN phosphatase YigB (HAD superfamily)